VEEKVNGVEASFTFSFIFFSGEGGMKGRAVKHTHTFGLFMERWWGVLGLQCNDELRNCMF